MTFPQPYNTIGYPGSLWAATFQFLNSDGSLMNITGKTFEWVLRTSTQAVGTPTLAVTSTTPTTNGSIVITTSTSSILVTLTPTGTALLAPNTTYAATLWMNPTLTDATVMTNGVFNTLAAAAP
jgi:hypothetical protein